MSYVFLSLWEQRAFESSRERELATDLSRMPVCDEKTGVKTLRLAGSPTDARVSVAVDGIEVGR